MSAKNDHGSVDAAMKSLVRYLLNKSKFIQPKNSAEKKEKIKQKNKKKPRVTDYKNLSTVGIQVVRGCKFLLKHVTNKNDLYFPTNVMLFVSSLIRSLLGAMFQ